MLQIVTNKLGWYVTMCYFYYTTKRNNMTQISDALKISSVKFNGYKIDLSENQKGKPTARLSRLLTVGVNKGTFKLLEGYYFKTEERRAEWVTKKMADVKERTSEKSARVNAKKEARANMVNPFKVGDIYYDSWGYDQTNIDFYEITEVKEKSVIIREIACKYVEGTSGHDSCNVMPVPGKYVGDPQLKPVVVSLNCEGKAVFHLKSRHGWISLYTKAEKGIYSSWGH